MGLISLRTFGPQSKPEDGVWKLVSWKGGVMLNNAPQAEPRWNPGTRKVVGATGFEPATPCAQGRCATRLRYAPTPIAWDFSSNVNRHQSDGPETVPERPSVPEGSGRYSTRSLRKAGARDPALATLNGEMTMPGSGSQPADVSRRERADC
jgi:hypothetical protein